MGFKFGVPIDADFIFDVRILPNPHWNPELRVKTGQDSEVAEFFAEFPEVDEMQQDIYQFLNRWLPEFLHNSQTYGYGGNWLYRRQTPLGIYYREAICQIVTKLAKRAKSND